MSGARRQDYDYLIKLLLIGDSGELRQDLSLGCVSICSSLFALQLHLAGMHLVQVLAKVAYCSGFSEDSFTSSFITTIGCAKGL